MGTRGAYGFRVNAEDKITYNHFDSYPGGLGEEMLKFVQETSFEEMQEIAKGIILVDGESEPTPEQIEKLKSLADLGVSRQTLKEWYALLRKSQGDLNVYKKDGVMADMKIMIDSHNFLGDSLFCEYAYIINIDTAELEFYMGFNETKGGAGRYADSTDGKYFGVRLADTISIEEIKKSNIDDIVNKWEGQSKED